MCVKVYPKILFSLSTWILKNMKFNIIVYRISVSAYFQFSVHCFLFDCLNKEYKYTEIIMEWNVFVQAHVAHGILNTL